MLEEGMGTSWLAGISLSILVPSHRQLHDLVVQGNVQSLPHCSSLDLQLREYCFSVVCYGQHNMKVPFQIPQRFQKCWLTRSHIFFSPDPNLSEIVSTTKDLCSWTNAVEKHWVKVYLRLSLSRDSAMALLNNFRFDLSFSSNSCVNRNWTYSIKSSKNIYFH